MFIIVDNKKLTMVNLKDVSMTVANGFMINIDDALCIGCGDHV